MKPLLSLCFTYPTAEQKATVVQSTRTSAGIIAPQQQTQLQKKILH